MRKRISVITGATGGIGREFVKLLLEDNVDEIWSVAWNIEKLNKLREEFGEKIIPISSDLSKEQSIDLLSGMLQEQKPMIAYLGYVCLRYICKIHAFVIEDISPQASYECLAKAN